MSKVQPREPWFSLGCVVLILLALLSLVEAVAHIFGGHVFPHRPFLVFFLVNACAATFVVDRAIVAGARESAPPTSEGERG